MSRRDEDRRLKRVLRGTVQAYRNIQRREMVIRNRDGTMGFKTLERGECVLTGPPDTGAVGSIRTLPTDPPSLTRGGYGSVSEQVAAGGVVWIERQEPREIYGGQTQTVTIVGRGFTEGLTGWRYLYPSPGGDAPVTVVEATYIDGEHYELTLDVSAEARAATGGRFRLGDRRRADFFDLVPAPSVTPGRYFAYWLEGSNLVAGYVGDDGSHLGTYGQLAAGVGEEDLPWCVPIRKSAQVPDGSLAVVTGGRLKILNFVDGVILERDAQAGRVAAAGYVDERGELMWLEFQPSSGPTCPVQLWRSGTDLQVPSLVGSGDIPATYDPGDSVSWQSEIFAAAFSDDWAGITVAYQGGPPPEIDNSSSGLFLYDGGFQGSPDPAPLTTGTCIPAGQPGAARGAIRWEPGLGGENEGGYFPIIQGWPIGPFSQGGPTGGDGQSVSVMYAPGPGVIAEVPVTGGPSAPPADAVYVHEPLPVLIFPNF